MKTQSEPLLNVTVGDGKYNLRQEADGRQHCLRHGEPWRDCVGDNLILCLGQEIEKLKHELEISKLAGEQLGKLYKQEKEWLQNVKSSRDETRAALVELADMAEVFEQTGGCDCAPNVNRECLNCKLTLFLMHNPALAKARGTQNK